MGETASSAFIHDATDENFAELVIANSRKGPVLVNYWSRKVGPCIRQYPVLENLALEFNGRFLLVNLDTDEFRALARDYGVTSLPTLKLFMNAEVVETRHGYQDESDMRYLLARYLPRASDRMLTEAVHVFQQGDSERALVMLAEAILEDPGNIRLPLTLARLMASEGRLNEAQQLLNNMPPEQRDDLQTRTLKGELELIMVHQQAPPADELNTLLARENEALEARYQLAAHYFIDDSYGDALQLLLEVLQRDRQFRNGDAQKAMTTIFATLGDEHELVRKYRAALQQSVH